MGASDQIQIQSPFSQNVHVGEIIWQTQQIVQNSFLRSQHRLASDPCSVHFNQCYIDCKGCFRLWCNCWFEHCRWSEIGQMELSLTISTLYDCLTNNSLQFIKAKIWSLSLHLLCIIFVDPPGSLCDHKTHLEIRNGEHEVWGQVGFGYGVLQFFHTGYTGLVQRDRNQPQICHCFFATLQKKSLIKKCPPYKNTVET